MCVCVCEMCSQRSLPARSDISGVRVSECDEDHGHVCQSQAEWAEWGLLHLTLSAVFPGAGLASRVGYGGSYHVVQELAPCLIHVVIFRVPCVEFEMLEHFHSLVFPFFLGGGVPFIMDP